MKRALYGIATGLVVGIILLIIGSIVYLAPHMRLLSAEQKTTSVLILFLIVMICTIVGGIIGLLTSKQTTLARILITIALSILPFALFGLIFLLTPFWNVLSLKVKIIIIGAIIVILMGVRHSK